MNEMNLKEMEIIFELLKNLNCMKQNNINMHHMLQQMLQEKTPTKTQIMATKKPSRKQTKASVKHGC